ncbi:hypothetical protein PENSPDRAFT_653486 [Peniophora sp. CONT]|nr:hypothetical protein PENSPDRAFT_653486 [Peniophora sp. CONT]
MTARREQSLSAIPVQSQAAHRCSHVDMLCTPSFLHEMIKIYISLRSAGLHKHSVCLHCVLQMTMASLVLARERCIRIMPARYKRTANQQSSTSPKSPSNPIYSTHSLRVNHALHTRRPRRPRRPPRSACSRGPAPGPSRPRLRAPFPSAAKCNPTDTRLCALGGRKQRVRLPRGPAIRVRRF